MKVLRFDYLNSKSRTLKSHILDPFMFEKLVASKTVGDIIEILSSTDYGNFLNKEKDIYTALNKYFDKFTQKILRFLDRNEREFFETFFFERKRIYKKKLYLKKHQNFEFFLRKIDLDFIKKLKKSLKRLPLSDRIDIKVITGSYFDMYNTTTILRLKFIYGLPVEDIIPFILPYGYKLRMEDFFHLSVLKNISEFSDYLSKKIGINFSDFTSFRKEIYRYHITQINRVWYGYPFKFSVPIGITRMKEIEIMNIKTVVEGVSYGIGEKDIKRMVVGVFDAFS
ncbi:V/A-type H+-transporting ATPase subunit C [Persephonella hydrogeniphila]|uniref:V/A-type H+-transporting ATPase subunit C n=1 Tax=Persephonella hydrogeniphila TaxID=198703 RepID=A0A285NMT7_9AQUI|nr:V-type ATPase subunit [Persephonella hydrogeniphila]SNZ09176.1 V/A-type H+-transporting ATPase subunit C [Persephonella hydrogeniphila]